MKEKRRAEARLLTNRGGLSVIAACDVTQLVLGATDGVLNLAFGLIHLAFGVELGVAGDFTGRFLDRTLGLFGSPGDAILVPDSSPLGPVPVEITGRCAEGCLCCKWICASIRLDFGKAAFYLCLNKGALHV